MKLEEAVGATLASRKPILFLGAGFANEATNLLDHPTPGSKQLTSIILSHLSLPGEATLGLAIDKLMERETPPKAFELIADNLTAKAVSATQSALLGMPWT